MGLGWCHFGGSGWLGGWRWGVWGSDRESGDRWHERKPEKGCAPVHENGQLFAHGWTKIEIGGVVSFTGAGLALSGLGGCGSLVKKRSDEGRVGGDLGTVSGVVVGWWWVMST